MKKRYKEPEVEIERLNAAEVLTESEEIVFEGDEWVKDPFFEET